jgi:hypothetical protein
MPMSPYLAAAVIFSLAVGLAAGREIPPEWRGPVMIAVAAVIVVGIFAVMLVMAFLGVIVIAWLRRF